MLTSAISTVGRWYPLYSGCGKIANSRRLRDLSRDLGIAPVTLHRRLPRHCRIYADPSDYVGRTLFYFGDLDPKVSWLCRSVLRRGDTVLDIGANLGLIAVIAAALVGPDGAVHAFEPQPRLAELLQRSADLNGFGHMTVHPIGLGDTDSDLRLYVPSDNGGAASFIRHRGALGPSVDVPVRRADAYLRDEGVGQVRLMKVDVEGFEPAVFRGAGDLLRSTPPDVILFEFNEPVGSVDQSASVRVLRQAGYRLYVIPRRFGRPRLVPLAELTPDVRYNDLVALSPGTPVPT